jgi:Predicted nucleotide-binding protein containing TIR-like domain
VSKNVQTFGDYLRHFARSVDIVDEHTLDDVRQLVHDYVRDELEAGYFSLASEQTVDGRVGLRTLWSTTNEEHSTTIRTAEGSYSSQISVAFGERKPLWIVSPDQRPLRESKEYVDQWSGVTDLPGYQSSIDRDMRTSIILPLIHWSRVLGVIYLESTSFLEITEVAKDELLLLADAVAILSELRQTNRAQVTGTRAALQDLKTVLNSTKFPRITKPQVFIAFSSRADDEVVGVIQQVLSEFGEKLRVVLWNKIEESGSITLRLIEEIARSTFGVCYFSEPVEGSDRQFEDNPNVLFEAGMLHSLTNSPVGTPSGWIPIREKQSPRIPFDFATERILLIERSPDGELMEERFRASLRSKVNALLRSGSEN